MGVVLSHLGPSVYKVDRISIIPAYRWGSSGSVIVVTEAGLGIPYAVFLPFHMLGDVDFLFTCLVM